MEIETLQEEYKESAAELDADRQREVEEISEEIVERKQFSENKRELANKITAEFGFEYVP